MSQAELIDGKAISEAILKEVEEGIQSLQSTHGITPELVVVMVGDRPDSATYVRMKQKAAEKIGIKSTQIHLAADVKEDELLKIIDDMNESKTVHAILVQLPLPEHINEHKVLSRILVEKDVDGFSAENIGNLCLKGGVPPLAVPCTPAGCVELLQRSNVNCSGKDAVVLGRSNIVGMPMAHLLMSMDATVTVVHSRTRNIEEHVRAADIVVAAIGKPEFVRGSWLKPGAVVIDVGINSVPDASKKSGYRLVGDVCFSEAVQVAGKITPVPGGVGPMTIAMLMKNTLNLARHASGLPRIPLRRQSQV